jgi:transposase
VASLIAAGPDGRHRHSDAGCGAIHPIKLNGIDPQAWLADIFARLPDHPAKRLGDLLPWNWRTAP